MSMTAHSASGRTPQLYREKQVIPLFYVVLVVKNPPTNAGDIRHIGSIPGSGRSPTRLEENVGWIRKCQNIQSVLSIGGSQGGQGHSK